MNDDDLKYLRAVGVLLRRGYVISDSTGVIERAADEIERLRAALGTAREYVEQVLGHEKDAYRGHEHVSDISLIETDLRDIDAALSGVSNG